MKKLIFFFGLLFLSADITAQKQTIAQMKLNLEAAGNPVAYARDVLKKKISLDTIIIMSTTSFQGVADSIAYHGKLRKVYGPFDKKYLVQPLGKSPNTFNRLSQIFIDTSFFTRRIADSLATSIIERVRSGAASFEDMARTYSMGGEARVKGDLGWIARGALQPEIEKELAKRKKGELFKIWTTTGLHIIRKSAEPKQDNGFALLLRVFL